MISKLKKLKGRSREELKVRGRQVLSAYAERYRVPPYAARIPSDAELLRSLNAGDLAGASLSSTEAALDHFRRRRSPHFFPAFANAEETRAELTRRWPQATPTLTERAGRAAEGRFDLLGLRDLHFGSPIDWRLEPSSGKKSPLAHWSRIDYLNAGEVGDKKITWELNRHQYFAGILGRAYWRTSDERFARVFAEHVASWAEDNPPKLGINWASSLEVAFRSISWLWALYFFRDSAHLTPPLFATLLKHLFVHAAHLESYLSTYFSPNTHLTGEALGLFYLGTLLPEFEGAAGWRATGAQILLHEIDLHVRPDGVYYEQSTYYHRYTADFYTHFLLLARANDQRLDGKVEEKLRALLDFLMFVTRPDGTTPLVGDDDGGRLTTLDDRAANDFRPALATGAALFRDPAYKFVAGEAAEETLWLLGPGGLKVFDEISARPPDQTSRAFGDGGYYVMRDGWTPTSNYALIDCGPHGAARCGYVHAHADALSFDLAANGRTLLVDPGTFTYTASAAARDHFRSSAAHNTLTIDGESSSAPDGVFRWSHVAQARRRAWATHRKFDFFEGEHDGYQRLPAPALHRRSVFFVKDRCWIIKDRVESAAPHQCEIHFHFASDAAPESEAASPVVRESGERGIELVSLAAGGRWQRRNDWVSTCYGARDPATVYTLSVPCQESNDLITILLPGGEEEGVARVRELSASRGRAIGVNGGGGGRRAVALIGGGEKRVETDRFASDFEWAWLECEEGVDEFDEMILIRGSRLSIDGRQVIRSGGFAEFVYARRANGVLFVEVSSSGTGPVTVTSDDPVKIEQQSCDVRS